MMEDLIVACIYIGGMLFFAWAIDYTPPSV